MMAILYGSEFQYVINLGNNMFFQYIVRSIASDQQERQQHEGRKEGTCLFDINIKHNTEIFIGKIISGDSH